MQVWFDLLHSDISLHSCNEFVASLIRSLTRTPYTKIENVPIVAVHGGTFRLATMGSELSAHPTTGAARSHSYTALAAAALPITVACSLLKGFDCVVDWRNLVRRLSFLFYELVGQASQALRQLLARGTRTEHQEGEALKSPIIDISLNMMRPTVAEITVMSPIPNPAMG